MRHRCEFIKLEVIHVRLPLRFSFRHARAVHHGADTVLLVLHTSSGVKGYGEFTTRDYLTGETIAGAIEDLRDHWWPVLKALNFSQQQDPLDVLKPLYWEADSARKTACYSGVEMAVLDAWCKAYPTGYRLPGYERRLLTITLGLGQQQLWLVRALCWLGFRDFKLKVSALDDIARVAKIRGVLGGQRRLRIDANEAFCSEDAIALGAGCAPLGLLGLEQPVLAQDLDGMARVRANQPLPIIADDAVCTTADLQQVVKAKAADIINLRLSKVGGLNGVKELAHQAQRNGLRVQLGVLVGQTSLANRLTLAAGGLTDFVFTEYGFPRLMLAVDPFAQQTDILPREAHFEGLLGASVDPDRLRIAPYICSHHLLG